MREKKLLKITEADERTWEKNKATWPVTDIVMLTFGKFPLKNWQRFAKVNGFTDEQTAAFIAAAENQNAIQAI